MTKSEISNKPKYIHHVNFPTTDPERTKQWYAKVFGLKAITPKSNTKVVLMTRGNFDLHFTPVEEMDRMAPYHFAIEVEDWDGFLAHLKELGIRHTRPVERPDEPTVNELAFRLRSCGLAWQDLALETPALEHALAVADRR